MRRALGKGLSELLGEQFEGGATEVPVEAIEPNLRQPRRVFRDEALEELAASIREWGILQPLVVRPIGVDKYELIAGERRWRAAQRVGLKTVPVMIRAAAPQQTLELALIENLQREDIGPLECARAYRRLMDEFGLTQEQVAERVGKSRTAIANTVRILRLPERILKGLEAQTITEGHARALLSFDNEARMLLAYEQIQAKGLTVREVESLSKEIPKPPPPKKNPVPVRDPNLRAVERAIGERLGAPVRIETKRISIEYFGDEDLARIVEILGVEL